MCNVCEHIVDGMDRKAFALLQYSLFSLIFALRAQRQPNFFLHSSTLDRVYIVCCQLPFSLSRANVCASVCVCVSGAVFGCTAHSRTNNTRGYIYLFWLFDGMAWRIIR